MLKTTAAPVLLAFKILEDLSFFSFVATQLSFATEGSVAEFAWFFALKSLSFGWSSNEWPIYLKMDSKMEKKEDEGEGEQSLEMQKETPSSLSLPSPNHETLTQDLSIVKVS